MLLLQWRELLGPVEVSPSGNRQVLQILVCNEAPSPLALPDAIVLSRHLELGQRGDPEILVEPE
ncbi:hypothetical protein LMTR13_10325 [Bradyrhizobium icense]|uniref:Uncharacterized protein n=1 Tax=Bradyrhizobium icense TaxID=1274631 RepID=A0A1B1UCK7_9BRAD|nr:hypothetical protein LMTR13_10325 [Bradyrhizobium icense]